MQRVGTYPPTYLPPCAWIPRAAGSVCVCVRACVWRCWRRQGCRAEQGWAEVWGGMGERRLCGGSAGVTCLYMCVCVCRFLVCVMDRVMGCERMAWGCRCDVMKGCDKLRKERCQSGHVKQIGDTCLLGRTAGSAYRARFSAGPRSEAGHRHKCDLSLVGVLAMDRLAARLAGADPGPSRHDCSQILPCRLVTPARRRCSCAIGIQNTAAKPRSQPSTGGRGPSAGQGKA